MPHLPRGRREIRLAELVRMLRIPVVLDDGQALDVAASVGAAALDVIGTRDLSVAQRAADAALYDGKHSGHPVLATKEHATVPSINGRRAADRAPPCGGELHEHRHRGVHDHGHSCEADEGSDDVEAIGALSVGDHAPGDRPGTHPKAVLDRALWWCTPGAPASEPVC